MAVPENNNGRSIARFGTFELDRDAGELRRDGLKVRLQDQPMRLLEVLLEQPGSVISREELRQRLWPADTFVEFDHALNTAVSKVREALGDSADNSRYLATVPRRGYRFIAPVDEISSTNGEPVVSLLEAEKGGRNRSAWRTAGAVVGIMALLAAGFYAGRVSNGSSESTEVPHRMLTVLHDFPGTEPLISPNGERIAFVPGSIIQGSDDSIRIQDLNTEEPRELTGTEGAYFAFWSPDSRSLGFFSAGQLRVVDTEDGAARVVCDVNGPGYGGTWSPDGETIVFAAPSPARLYEVPARGGVPRPMELTSSGTQVSPMCPVFARPSSGPPLLLAHFNSGKGNDIVLVNLRTHEAHPVGRGVKPIAWSNGHILYQEYWPVGDLVALPYSLEDLRPTGDPFVVAEGVSNVSVARDGTMVYTPSDAVRWQLAWLNRVGERLRFEGDSYDRVLFYPALSPNERYILFDSGKNPRDVWLWDRDRSVTSRFTNHSAHDTVGTWSRDGDKVYFVSHRDGSADIYTKRLDSGEKAEKLVGTSLYEHVGEESPNGSIFLYHTQDPERSADIWFVEPKKDGTGFEHIPFLQTPSNESGGRFSPDGSWVAYCSDLSGREEIYVRRFPEGTEVRQVSRYGGTQVRWSRDGRQIFYVEGQTLMSTRVKFDPEISVSGPEALFSHPNLLSYWSWPTYDVSADGEKFLVVETVNSSRAGTRVVQNWFGEFRDRQ